MRPRISIVFVSILSMFEKNMYLQLSVNAIDNVLFRLYVSLLICFLVVLLMLATERGALKFTLY